MAWPDPLSPLDVRLATLRSNIMRLQEWKFRHDETYFIKKDEYDIAYSSWKPGQPRPIPPREPESSRALIVSTKWLEEASRVARRATTQGGDDRALLEDCLDTLSQINEQQTKERGFGPPSFFVNYSRSYIHRGFMFGDQSYIAGAVSEIHETELSSEARISAWVGEAIHQTLQGYINTTDDWKKQLYASRIDMEWLLRSKHTLLFDSNVVRLINKEFMPGSDLWNSKVSLQ